MTKLLELIKQFETFMQTCLTVNNDSLMADLKQLRENTHNIAEILKGSYDAISSFPFSLECYKLFMHR